MNKRLWIVLAVLVIAVFGAIVFTKNSKTDDLAYVEHLDGSKIITKDDIVAAKEKVKGSKLTDEERDKVLSDHFLGKKDSKVTVIEYEDFACTHCQSFHTYANKIKDDYKDRVLFIFRDFSLSFPNSTVTLSAGEAAQKLGGNDAFWKMNKLLFHDEKWVSQAVASDERKSVLNDYAKQSGIDVDKFNDLLANYSNNGIQDKISRDRKIGENAGVSGTPTWFVNGKKIDSVTDQAVREAIDSALKSDK